MRDNDDNMALLPNESESADGQRCLKCDHPVTLDSPDEGGWCVVEVPTCSDDYHGTRLCGCKCESPIAANEARCTHCGGELAHVIMPANAPNGTMCSECFHQGHHGIKGKSCPVCAANEAVEGEAPDIKAILDRIKQIIRDEAVIEGETSPHAATKNLRRKIIWRIEDEQHAWLRARAYSPVTVDEAARRAAEKVTNALDGLIKTHDNFDGLENSIAEIIATELNTRAPDASTLKACTNCNRQLQQSRNGAWFHVDTGVQSCGLWDDPRADASKDNQESGEEMRQ